MSDTLETVTVKLRKNGDLTIDDDGKAVVVAHYDRVKSHLEFTTKAYASQYYNQCVARIGTVNKGMDVSNFTVKTFGVVGDERTDLSKVPKRPKLGKLGDSAEDFVAWYLKHDLPGAIIRYGIYTDENGKVVRKSVRRIVENTVDVRATLEDEQVEWHNVGPKSREKGPVTREREAIVLENQVIARRATALTFTPSEVVGGFQPDEDDDYTPGATPANEEDQS